MLVQFPSIVEVFHVSEMLGTNEQVQLTPQEETLLQEWKDRAGRSFEFGSLAGGGVAYLGISAHHH